ncbi:cytochrome C [Hyphomicrobium nitrativorans NL23]|uniref:Cytochrome C n=1 Tax=Hyphomicrobium nitrativorans NL23 TaxID=1029756 RepID=V5SC22_9HYPH|nr:DUF3365 domain-containing protein [Hyphomicrobium nitrativorans]AHB48078.1 cytochrome C [Hyphomicrobium nitrativorans NL23]
MPRAALLIGLTVAIAPAQAWADNPPPFETGGNLAAARAAAKDLGENLRSELIAALKAGGPSAALGVCRTVAPSIAENASKTHDLTVGRTALKVRNPDNTPDAFERRVLADFVRKAAAGSDPATLEHAEIATENGKSTFRYMKAIPTAAEPCLVCHGSNIEASLKAEILELYPSDEATGFVAGELRGAFTVRRQIR